MITSGLRVLFCGINPGLYSAAVGHHFGRPGNRFWPVLHASGFSPRCLAPSEQRVLLDLGCGITNVVARTTARADELTAAEIVAGGRALRSKVCRQRPAYLAVLGVGAYRTAFGCRAAGVGLQSEALGGTRLWVLPNPSGRNAHYGAADLAALFAELRRVAFS